MTKKITLFFWLVLFGATYASQEREPIQKSADVISLLAKNKIAWIHSDAVWHERERNWIRSKPVQDLYFWKDYYSSQDVKLQWNDYEKSREKFRDSWIFVPTKECLMKVERRARCYVESYEQALLYTFRTDSLYSRLCLLRLDLNRALPVKPVVEIVEGYLGKKGTQERAV
jgi:hypothetical protein